MNVTILTRAHGLGIAALEHGVQLFWPKIGSSSSQSPKMYKASVNIENQRLS